MSIWISVACGLKCFDWTVRLGKYYANVPCYSWMCILPRMLLQLVTNHEIKKYNQYSDVISNL